MEFFGNRIERYTVVRLNSFGTKIKWTVPSDIPLATGEDMVGTLGHLNGVYGVEYRGFYPEVPGTGQIS